MSDSRTRILSAIRNSLNEGGHRSETILDGLEEHLRRVRPQVQPSFADDLVERFCEKHVAVHGTVERVKGISAIVGALELHLRRYSLEPNVLVGAGKMLDLIDWPGSW